MRRGEAEAFVMTYAPGQFPFAPLGPVHVLLQAVGDAAVVWSHPACAAEIVAALQAAASSLSKYAPPHSAQCWHQPFLTFSLMLLTTAPSLYL